MHDDYHKVTDDPDRLIYKGMAQITRFLFTLVNEMEKRNNYSAPSQKIER